MVNLIRSTNDELADRALRDVIGDFEMAYPHRIRGYYVLGSYADGSEVVASDLDLVILFTSFRNEAERDAAHLRAQEWIRDTEIELDIQLVAEDVARQGVDPNLKYGSVLVYGQDARDNLPLMPIEEWTRDRMHSSYWRVARLFTRPEIITYPVTYPDPTAEFYGYDRRIVRLGDGRRVPCTRDLIRLTGWAATARLAYEHGIYVARKSECHTLYRAHIGDEWSSLLEDIYTLCRSRWSYLIPDDPEERALLRALCARTLGFENAFLAMYTRYLIAELRGSETTAVEAALQMLVLAPYREAGVIAALEDLTRRDNDHLRTIATTASEKLRSASA